MSGNSFRAPLLWLLLPMICGYVLGYHLPNLPQFSIGAFSLLSLTLALVSLRTKSDFIQRFAWPTFFCLGVSAASLVYFQNSRSFPELWQELPPREANLQLKVVRLYSSNDPVLIKGIATIEGAETHLRNLIGYPVYFSINAEGKTIDRGQHFLARGVLSYLPSRESLTLFEQYLAGQSLSLTFTRAYLTGEPQEGNLFEQLRGALRKKAIDSLGIGLQKYPEELGVYRGMMLGIKGELSQEDKELFLHTGTLHLFAISGLHVGIIAVAWASIFLILRVPKHISVIVGLSLVYLYVEVTGASPSAVRAFAMTAFFWAGKSLLRQMPPFQALVASAATVLLLSPAQLFSSGFQLSYTVVTGILLWGIPLYQTLREQWYARMLEKPQHLTRLGKIINKSWEIVVGTFCISISATISSAPLSILYFGLLAPLAVMLNMLLVPIASLIIISGLFSLIFSFLPTTLTSSFFNHGPLLLIQLIGGFLEWTVNLSGAFVMMSWVDDRLGYVTACLFLGSLLAGHGFKLPKIWLFTFPVVLTAAMILVNPLIRYF